MYLVRVFPQKNEDLVQLGKGVSGGLEAAVHSLRVLLDRNQHFLALSLDSKNAIQFNSQSRRGKAGATSAMRIELNAFFVSRYSARKC
eukprot:3456153-Pyramimonas_sp.AAC.1